MMRSRLRASWKEEPLSLTCQKMLSMVLPKNPSLLSDDSSLGPSIVMNSSKSTWPSPTGKCTHEGRETKKNNNTQNIQMANQINTNLFYNEVCLFPETNKTDQQMDLLSSMTNASTSSALIQLSNEVAPVCDCVPVEELCFCVVIQGPFGKFTFKVQHL